MGFSLWSFPVRDEANIRLVMQFLLFDDTNLSPGVNKSRAELCFCLLTKTCNSYLKHDAQPLRVSFRYGIAMIISPIQQILI